MKDHCEAYRQKDGATCFNRPTFALLGGRRGPFKIWPHVLCGVHALVAKAHGFRVRKLQKGALERLT